MIIGLGTDLIDIRRIEKVLRRHGQRFITRCFTKSEIEKAESRSDQSAKIATYAKRFAAKEACVKALGTGFRGGITFQDIEVINDEKGALTINLKGAAEEKLKTLLPDKTSGKIHLSISDEPPYAIASVIVEAHYSRFN